MLATHPTTNSSVNVNLEKLNSFQLMNLNIKANLESQFPTITATLKNMGFSNINIQYQKLTVDGKEYDGLVISATLNNIPMYQAAFAFLRGNYLACVTVCSMQTDNRTSILNYFSFD
jgi:hypothetical protein